MWKVYPPSIYGYIIWLLYIITELDNGESSAFFFSTALHLLDVQNYDKRPAIQGQLLTLVCTARGSEFLNFRWFKDGALVRTDLANRNAWEQRVPATVHETQLDILNIENVKPLDKGTS